MAWPLQQSPLDVQVEAPTEAEMAAFSVKVGGSREQVRSATELDWSNKAHYWSNKELTAGDCKVIAHLIAAKFMPVLTELNLKWNNFGAEGAIKIAESLKVNSALMSVKLEGNELGDEGWGAIFAGICGNKDSKIMSLDASEENIGLAGGKLIAKALRTSVTGALTKLSLARNKLGEEGTKAICEALEQNTTLKELDISGGHDDSNIGGSAGAKHVAKMVGVNGALTEVR